MLDRSFLSAKQTRSVECSADVFALIAFRKQSSGKNPCTWKWGVAVAPAPLCQSSCSHSLDSKCELVCFHHVMLCICMYDKIH